MKGESEMQEVLGEDRRGEMRRQDGARETERNSRSTRGNKQWVGNPRSVWYTLLENYPGYRITLKCAWIVFPFSFSSFSTPRPRSYTHTQTRTYRHTQGRIIFGVFCSFYRFFSFLLENNNHGHYGIAAGTPGVYIPVLGGGVAVRLGKIKTTCLCVYAVCKSRVNSREGRINFSH